MLVCLSALSASGGLAASCTMAFERLLVPQSHPYASSPNVRGTGRLTPIASAWTLQRCRRFGSLSTLNCTLRPSEPALPGDPLLETLLEDCNFRVPSFIWRSESKLQHISMSVVKILAKDLPGIVRLGAFGHYHTEKKPFGRASAKTFQAEAPSNTPEITKTSLKIRAK